MTCVMIVTAILATWTVLAGPKVCDLLKSKAAYWDACTREKDGKAGWSR